MPKATPQQNRAVVQSLVSLVVTLVVMGLLMFVPAGTLDWPRGWWFFAAFIVAILISVLLLWRLNPEIFAARAKVAAGTKPLDYLFLVLIMAGFAAILPVAALDFRFGWTPTLRHRAASRLHQRLPAGDQRGAGAWLALGAFARGDCGDRAHPAHAVRGANVARGTARLHGLHPAREMALGARRVVTARSDRDRS